jgi:hypothetical protein
LLDCDCISESGISLAHQEITERSSAGRVGTGFLLALLSTLASVVGLRLHKFWMSVGLCIKIASELVTSHDKFK